MKGMQNLINPLLTSDSLVKKKSSALINISLAIYANEYPRNIMPISKSLPYWLKERSKYILDIVEIKRDMHCQSDSNKQ